MSDEEIFQGPEFQESMEQLRNGETVPALTSAEEQAEEILKEAFTKIDLTGEDCPQGDACAIHHRNDEEFLDDDNKYGRIITYTGEYAVITSDNPELENPAVIMRLILGLVKPEEIPAQYETCVIFVGGGTLADLRTKADDDRRECLRFVQPHNEWDNFKDAHAVVVNGVKEGLLDLSKPAFPKAG